MIDGRHASDVLDVRSYWYTAPDIEHHDTDHFLLGAKIRARICNISKSNGTKSRRLDVAKLRDEQTEKRFSEKLNEKLNALVPEAVQWSHFRDAMTETAEEVLGYKQPIRNEWFDDECKRAVEAVIKARTESGRMTRVKTERARALQKAKKKNYPREEKASRPANDSRN